MNEILSTIFVIVAVIFFYRVGKSMYDRKFKK